MGQRRRPLQGRDGRGIERKRCRGDARRLQIRTKRRSGDRRVLEDDALAPIHSFISALERRLHALASRGVAGRRLPILSPTEATRLLDKRDERRRIGREETRFCPGLFRDLVEIFLGVRQLSGEGVGNRPQVTRVGTRLAE